MSIVARLGRTAVLAALPLLVACSSESGAAPQPADKVLLLFTSDEHSQLFARSPELDDFPLATTAGSGALRGGIARRATIVAAQRVAAAKAGADTLLVSAGDNHFGTLSELMFVYGSTDYGAMHALDYAATTIGNHELDLGPTALAAAITAARDTGGLPPIVASNIHFSDAEDGDDALAALFSDDATDDLPIHRYRVVTTTNGIRVGFVAAMGVNASAVAPNKAPVTFSEREVDPADQDDPDVVLPALYADLQPVVDAVRQEADVVVALSHAGVADPANPQGSEDYRIAQNVSGIDVVVSGHAHTDDPTPIVVRNVASGRDVLILNAGFEGRYVGRVELARSTAATVWGDATQLPVDDRTVPDAAAVAYTESALAKIEARTELSDLLSRVEGQSVPAGAPGSLYFHKLAHTGFDLADTHGLLFLTADAQLAAADAVAPTAFALQSAGVVRGVLATGKTGDISVADPFAVVPLGSSPVNGSYGYPLVRAYLPGLFLRAIFEFSSTLGATDSDFDLATAGVTVQYDCARPPVTSVADLLDASKGRVMRIALDTDHADGIEQFDKVIYQRGGVSEGGPFSVVTSSYIAQFASRVGASLLGEDGKPLTVEQAILHRPDGSEVKELEALLGYLRNAPEGELPARYNPGSAGATSRFADFARCE